MYRIIALLIGYVFGMFQTAYFVGRKAGIDIREHGSKNAGFNNTSRVLGRNAGIIVFIMDIVKTALAFIVATLIFDGGGWFMGAGSILPGIYAAVGAVLGHDFPAFLKFKGGKGIVCSLVLILMIDWQIALITFAVGIVLVVLFRYISVASLTMTALAPILMFFWDFETEAVLLAAAAGVLAWVLHHENIGRILKGNERKFSFKKKPDAVS